MTIQELINELNVHDLQLEVRIESSGGEYAPQPISSVQIEQVRDRITQTNKSAVIIS